MAVGCKRRLAVLATNEGGHMTRRVICRVARGPCQLFVSLVFVSLVTSIDDHPALPSPPSSNTRTKQHGTQGLAGDTKLLVGLVGRERSRVPPTHVRRPGLLEGVDGAERQGADGE